MKYAFGIDGGGTRSRIRIIDAQNRTCAETEGGSTNIYSVGTETALLHLRCLIETACRIAGLSTADLSAGCIGSAGITRDEEIRIFHACFQDFLGQNVPVSVCNDGEILLVGKLHVKEGYCLISGTGSFALARNSAGETVRAGGLGHMLGDEGSACWIGWQAIKRTLRSTEKRDMPTAMLPALLEYFSLDSLWDFVVTMHQHFQKTHIAAAAPMVVDFARQGDALAMDICSQAADELFLLLQSVIERLPLQGGIALAGGILENYMPIKEALSRRLEGTYPAHPVVRGGGTALDGACILAAELLNSRANAR